MNSVKNYIQENKDRFIAELIELLKMPSISADAAYSQDVLNTSEAVKDALEKAGCDKVEICETPGYPIVYGEKTIDPALPTVLVYGHYDVQPADPIELWDSDPFEPVIKKTDIHPDGAIFARGACDDKGQMFMHVKALEYMVRNNVLPCNVKFMIEGEEEVGSGSLSWFVKNNHEKLKNDIILISDTGMLANDTPSITTGLRGLSYVEVEVTSANRDLHSGLYGGAVANPINVLTKMIASLHDENNHITIPHFYDKVEELSQAERDEMAKAPFSLEAYKKALDIDAVYGEKGYTTTERASIRPTLDVNGIWGGYTGQGAKTVIPSKAYATISITPHHGGQGYVTPTDTPAYQAAVKACKESFGKEPIPVRSGGSIPIVALFEEELGSKSILLGFGLDSDAIHSPNEHYGIFNFLKGIETIPWFYHYFVNNK